MKFIINNQLSEINIFINSQKIYNSSFPCLNNTSTNDLIRPNDKLLINCSTSDDPLDPFINCYNNDIIYSGIKCNLTLNPPNIFLQLPTSNTFKNKILTYISIIFIVFLIFLTIV